MEVRNSVYNEHGTIDCEVEHPDYGWIPFTASPEDPEEHGRQLFSALKDAAAAYTPPPPPPEEEVRAAQCEEARLARNRLLNNSDWTQMSDAPVDQAAWATYRQALRDLPDQPGFPADIVWPKKPE